MAAAPAIPKASAEVTASELWAAYARDPAQANLQFRDRAVVVTGVVRSVERDYEGSMVARLSTGDAFETVNAKLATRNDPTLVGVTKGRPVSLLCVGRGALDGRAAARRLLRPIARRPGSRRSAINVRWRRVAGGVAGRRGEQPLVRLCGGHLPRRGRALQVAVGEQ